MAKSERELLSEISQKLDRLIALFAVQGKNEDDQIAMLRGMGFDWKFIGAVTSLRPNTATQRHKRSTKT